VWVYIIAKIESMGYNITSKNSDCNRKEIAMNAAILVILGLAVAAVIVFARITTVSNGAPTEPLVQEYLDGLKKHPDYKPKAKDYTI
jgi:hypothetical protein